MVTPAMLVRPMVKTPQRLDTRRSVAGVTLAGRASQEVQVVAAIPVLVMGEALQAKATQASMAQAPVEVAAAATVRLVAQTVRVKAAMVRSTGESQRQPSVMQAVAVRATTTPVSRKSVALMEGATVPRPPQPTLGAAGRILVVAVEAAMLRPSTTRMILRPVGVALVSV